MDFANVTDARVKPAHHNHVAQIDLGTVPAQHKMSHCRGTDSVAVSVLPNVAIILSHPNPVLAVRQVLRLEVLGLVESRLVVRT